jgi:succinate dehydrogenase / fumarate reductase cytochrome b subunit
MARITTGEDAARARPLSPHLQIYRFTWTMAMSIAHRLTGVALYAGTAFVALWLVLAASGPEGFATAQALAGSWLGLLVLFGYTFALMHHMLGGLRHFVLDVGSQYGFANRMLMAKLNLALSAGLTILIWVAAFLLRQG